MLASVPPTGISPPGTAGVGATEAERLVPGVVLPDGGGGMSVLSTRVAFFFGLGAGVSYVADDSWLLYWETDMDAAHSPLVFSLM